MYVYMPENKQTNKQIDRQMFQLGFCGFLTVQCSAVVHQKEETKKVVVVVSVFLFS